MEMMEDERWGEQHFVTPDAFDHITAHCRERVAAGASPTDIVTYLHGQGYSMIQTLAVVTRACALFVGTARRDVVWFSGWSDEDRRAYGKHDWTDFVLDAWLLAFDCEDMIKRGASQDEIITHAHGHGYDVAMTAALIEDLYHLSEDEAMNVVASHPVWTHEERNQALKTDSD